MNCHSKPFILFLWRESEWICLCASDDAVWSSCTWASSHKLMDRHLTDTWCSSIVNRFCQLPFHFLIQYNVVAFTHWFLVLFSHLDLPLSGSIIDVLPWLVQAWMATPTYGCTEAVRLHLTLPGAAAEVAQCVGKRHKPGQAELGQHEHSWAIKAPVRQRQSAGGWVASCSPFRQEHWSRKKKLPPSRGCPGNNEKWEDATMRWHGSPVEDRLLLNVLMRPVVVNEYPFMLMLREVVRSIAPVQNVGHNRSTIHL